MILVDIAVCKLLPTQLTFVRFVLAVDDLMSRHLVQTLEWPTADLTGVRSLLWSVTDYQRLSPRSRENAWSKKVSSSLQRHRLTRVCYHVAFQLIRRDELFVTSVAFKYFVYLRYKSKKQSESIWSFVLADHWKNSGEMSCESSRISVCDGQLKLNLVRFH